MFKIVLKHPILFFAPEKYEIKPSITIFLIEQHAEFSLNSQFYEIWKSLKDRKMISGTIRYDEFEKVDLRAGTIIRAETFPEAKKPAYKLWVDFAELGIKTSSAQITEHYQLNELIGKQVICVVNFEPRQIANFLSEVLITGFPDEKNHVVLCSIDKNVPDGARLY